MDSVPKASTSYLQAPFEVFHMLPQGHDKALKQAFYNIGAFFFVAIVLIVCLAVYNILHVFLKPLLWAVLCGSFLYPFKKKLCELVGNWMKSMEDSGTPIFVSVIFIPFQLVDVISETFATFLVEKWKYIVTIITSLCSIYFLYHFGPLHSIINWLMFFLYILYEIVGHFNHPYIIWSIIFCYILVIILFWTPETKSVLKRLSIPVWVIFIFHCSSISGRIRVPLIIIISSLMIIGLITEILSTAKKQQEKPVSPNYVKRLLSIETLATIAFPRTKKNSDQQNEKDNVDSNFKFDDIKKSNPFSEKFIVGLVYVIVIVQLWNNFWFIVQLGPLIVLPVLGKRLGYKFGFWQFLKEKFDLVLSHLTVKVRDDSRFDLIAPKPIRGLFLLLGKGDSKVRYALKKGSDKILTAIIISVLFMTFFVLSFFIMVQVHRESMHILSISSNVVNKTMKSDLSGWIPHNEHMQQAINKMLDKGYHFGRKWIADKIADSMENDDSSKERVINQVLEIWDKMYHNWISRNNSLESSLKRPFLQRSFSNTEYKEFSLKTLWNTMTNISGLDIYLVGLFKENMHVFTSVLESIYTVLKGNVNLAFNILTATISLILGGGTVLLNFLVSLFVFLSALFYLLSSSKETYVPLKWISAISFSNVEETAAEAIGSVFLATFKMMLFYGLYTWLTHTLFGINIVFIPAALAAILGAVPLLGTYWAALPAFLELWLVNNDFVAAVSLSVFHILPTYIVDTTIYSEIKGGHPYLTGLAIIGGVYWLGLEGAIFGPIILCCLIVSTNVYTRIITPETPIQTGALSPLVKNENKVLR